MTIDPDCARKAIHHLTAALEHLTKANHYLPAGCPQIRRNLVEGKWAIDESVTSIGDLSRVSPP